MVTDSFVILLMYRYKRVFTSIYNDELARLKEEYGEKAKGNVSYSKIKVDISAERSKEKNNNEGNTIDLQI